MILTRKGGLAEHGIGTGSEHQLVDAPSDSGVILIDPATSPDGRQMAFISQPVSLGNEAPRDLGADLWIARRDGTHRRLLLKHAHQNQAMRSPQWQDDRHMLVVINEPAVCEGCNSATAVVSTLELIDIDTGGRTRIRDNIIEYGLSPDQTRIVYVDLSGPGDESLEEVRLDGSYHRTLVASDAHLAQLGSPRYSPDGRTVAFSGSDGRSVMVGGAYGSIQRGAPVALEAYFHNDGLADDLWIVRDGGASLRVASLRENSPSLTWSGNGEHVFILGASALYDVDMRTHSLRRIGDGFAHGHVTWTQ